MSEPEESLSLQLASLKEVLEKQQRLLLSDTIVTELCSMLRVEAPESLVFAVKERIAKLCAQVEEARRDKEEGIAFEKQQYAHFENAYNTLRSKLAITQDRLEAAQLRVNVLESTERLRMLEGQ